MEELTFSTSNKAPSIPQTADLNALEISLINTAIQMINESSESFQSILRYVENTLMEHMEILSFSEVIDSYQKILIHLSLDLNHQNTAAAARTLNINRTTLAMLRQRLGFPRKKNKYEMKMDEKRCPHCNQIMRRRLWRG